MRPIRFTHEREGALFAARYEEEESALETTWPGLILGGPEYVPDKWWTYGAYGDEYAVYAALAWRVCSGLSLYASSSYYGERAEALLKRSGEMVRWEFRVATESRPIDIKGFVRGRTQNLEVQNGNGPDIWDYALLFQINSWAELVQAQLATRGDAAGEVNIFALLEGRENDLASFLAQDRRPSLEKFLLPGEKFMTLCTGEDLGYSNVVLCYSVDDQRDVCDGCADSVNQQLARYEAKVSGINTIEEFIDSVTSFALG
jgi:hypothetical protein